MTNEEEGRLLTVEDEHKQMEVALRAILGHPEYARLIADTSLKLIDANRRIRADMLLSDIDR